MVMDMSDIAFSAPLQRLVDEHVSLRIEMDLFYEITEEIEYVSGQAVIEHFAELHKRISSFSDALKQHSRKEDDGLFPILAGHLAPSDRTIEAMEFEHEKAEQHLQDFIAEAEQARDLMCEDEAKSIAVNAVQAYATLTQHFAKEEKQLFPLAEKLLSVDEKAELLRRFWR
jgi:regulator of cell morphogenesis and NO signaling